MHGNYVKPRSNYEDDVELAPKKWQGGVHVQTQRRHLHNIEEDGHGYGTGRRKEQSDDACCDRARPGFLPSEDKRSYFSKRAGSDEPNTDVKAVKAATRSAVCMPVGWCVTRVA